MAIERSDSKPTAYRLRCEDCDGDTFNIEYPSGTLFCATCDEDRDGSYGRMVNVKCVGDGGPLGPIGAEP